MVNVNLDLSRRSPVEYLTPLQLATINPALLEFHYYPKNFHENFNEVNRETIFGNILTWMRKQVSSL